MARLKQQKLERVALWIMGALALLGVTGRWAPWESIVVRSSQFTTGQVTRVSSPLAIPDAKASGLGLKQESASVILRRISPFVKEVLVNKGALDGVRPGMLVMSDNWLLGKVVKVSKKSAWVTLVSDPSFRIGVQIESLNALGVLKGAGSALFVDRVPTGAQVASRLVVTYGGTEQGVAGLPVGITSSKRVSVSDTSLERWLVDRSLREEFALNANIIFPVSK